jgi:hypothetical protein
MNYKTSFNSRLRIKLQLAYDSKEGKNTALPSGQNAPAWFRDYLIVTHSIIRLSVPLMHAAYGLCSDLSEEGKLMTELRNIIRNIFKKK